MGGIPPLAGFNAKISVLLVLIEKAFTEPLGGLLPIVVLVALISSVLSVFYYIRIIKILSFVSTAHTTKNPVIFKIQKRSIGHFFGIYVLAFTTAFNLFSFLLFLV